MMELILIVVCITCGGLIIYHHVGYPLFLKWYSKSHPIKTVPKTLRGYRQAQNDSLRPSVTVVVPAFNESRWIAEKIRNLAALDYPKSQLTVIIACDGCTDDTVEIAEQTIQEAICSDTYFEVHSYTLNRGKVALLNDEMTYVQSEITAFSDVSALISLDALLIAEQHFMNPDVGVVNAQYQLLDQTNQGETNYWRYQGQVKLNEASLGSTLGAHGALYLFRTALFEPLSENTINDDFVLPMEIIRKGYLAHYEPNMVALELEPTQQESDFKRRLRISAGNMQQMIHLFELFSPRYKGVAFAFFSGKGLRLATPYLMLICFSCSLVLMHNFLFMILLLLQIFAYSLGALGVLFPRLFSYKICQLVTYIVAGHYANFIGGLRYLLGLENGRWARVNR
ncbi:glycosyltransferase family 2 protein [Vibrio aestuarianus]|uniref:Glycosyltransferase family 2 protein n=1 Tax=Vibrio aestuarianus TaxID=28171 RepID=A0AAX3U8E5_9VIBR|nr:MULTISPECIES: glycosyltransferase family 2 protein [Vibrio]MDE1221696.1 glycosyltransferase family 2 protein [Vibrio aestuarianus]MDE1249617.1 glycosyltransferase family 2 protein [Vibrio aestuarianus]MDE1323954.1 glycosyltransferase family 2 protein [Vibrio aestuarianus]MDE1349457.1 glycosyltransferase family 2 protein [Vibrio aestuarianus]MDF9400105.1 glycosyltransferase family 2 protein [Vibrio sp. 1180_3]